MEHTPLMSAEFLMPVRTERLSASQFVKAVEQDRSNIARSRFIPSSIGSRSFGRFEVQYKVPVLKSGARYE